MLKVFGVKIKEIDFNGNYKNYYDCVIDFLKLENDKLNTSDKRNNNFTPNLINDINFY